MKTIFTILLLAVLLVSFADAELSCPKVLDGLTNGHFDLATQFSVSEISGNWIGLPRDRILGYEWAIISEEKMNSKMKESECLDNQGFSGIPDVLSWVNIKKDTSATAKNLALEPNTTYYIVLRTTLADGSHVFSFSNGIFILPQELHLEGSHRRSEEIVEEREEREEERDCLVSECPIDEANRCRRGEIAVNEILSELYGPPRFAGAGPFVPIFPDDDDDDDDDDEGGTGSFFGILAGAIIGLLALLLICCLFFLLLGLLFAKGGGGDQKFSENVTSKQTEQVDADFGTTTEHAIADDTRVEFPDYDPSTRLSVA